MLCPISGCYLAPSSGIHCPITFGEVGLFWVVTSTVILGNLSLQIDGTW